MAKHYLFKRPDAKFEGTRTIVRDTETRRIVDEIPDLGQGRFHSPWRAYEMALQSITKGADLLSIINLRRKLQEASDAEDATFDARFVVLTEGEKALIVEAVKSFDWTFSKTKGALGTSFFVTWLELFDSVLNTESKNYGFSDYDINRPSAEYVADISAFDTRKAVVDARFEEAKVKYAASKDNRAAPAADVPTEPAVEDNT